MNKMDRWALGLVFVPLLFPHMGNLAAGGAVSETEELYRRYVEPGPAYRGKPFWSWNGELKQDELIRQIHVLKEMGFGGFFMHSRTGLATEYLGDEWFALTNARGCTTRTAGPRGRRADS